MLDPIIRTIAFQRKQFCCSVTVALSSSSSSLHTIIMFCRFRIMPRVVTYFKLSTQLITQRPRPPFISAVISLSSKCCTCNYNFIYIKKFFKPKALCCLVNDTVRIFVFQQYRTFNGIALSVRKENVSFLGNIM